MAYRARNIMIAVALAAVAALLTSFYVTSYKRHVQRGEDHVTVLVAKKDLPEGTSGADILDASPLGSARHAPHAGAPTMTPRAAVAKRPGTNPARESMPRRSRSSRNDAGSAGRD